MYKKALKLKKKHLIFAIVLSLTFFVGNLWSMSTEGVASQESWVGDIDAINMFLSGENPGEILQNRLREENRNRHSEQEESRND